MAVVPLPSLARVADPAWRGQLLAGESQRLARLMQAEAADGRHPATVYELFSEMEEKDGHLYAVLQTRQNGLLGLERTVQPASNAPRDVAAADFVRGALDGLAFFDGFLRALLESLAKGFAVVELHWDYDASGRLVPRGWTPHPQEAFALADDGTLLLLCPPFAPPSDADRFDDVAAGRALGWSHAARPAPPRRFVAMTFGRDARNPYGRGLSQRAYSYYYFKRVNLRLWAVHNERYGAPTAVATCAQGTPDEDRRRILEALQTLQTDAGIVVPETITVKLLEASGRGEGATYRALADWCNDEISKIVLGATLTTSEGRRSGSLALGSIHDAVRHDYVEADARLLAATINDTLVRWMVELNFPGLARAPRWMLDASPAKDLEQQARVDAALIAMGVPLPHSHFYARYGRPVPVAGEPRITYDDGNLFQYHLQHGVLTINEVRARLQLPPVPWGDRRTGGMFRAPRGFNVHNEELNIGAATDERAETASEREPYEH